MSKHRLLIVNDASVAEIIRAERSRPRGSGIELEVNRVADDDVGPRFAAIVRRILDRHRREGGV